MAKTKKTKVAVSSAASKNIAPKAHSVSHEGCCDLGHCWLCWLFKSLIVLFCAFLVLWVGFYCGLMSAQSRTTRMDPALERMLNQTKRSCNNGSCAMMSKTIRPVTIDQLMGDMTAALANKTGEIFDKELLVQMMLHHEGAVEMAKLGLEKSQNPEIKKFCQAIIDAQATEIEQIKTLQAAPKQ